MGVCKGGSQSVGVCRGGRAWVCVGGAVRARAAKESTQFYKDSCTGAYPLPLCQ